MCKEWVEGKLDMFSHIIVMHLEDDRVARCKNVEEFIELLVGVEEGNMVASDIIEKSMDKLFYLFFILLPEQ